MKKEEIKDKSVFTMDGRFIGWGIGERYEDEKRILDVKIPVNIVDSLPREKAEKIEVGRRFARHGILSMDMNAIHEIKDIIILRCDENLNEIEAPGKEELKEKEWPTELENLRKSIEELKKSNEDIKTQLKNLGGAVTSVMPIEAEEKVIAEKIGELMEKRVQIQESIENNEREFMEGTISKDEYEERRKVDKKRLEELEEQLQEYLKKKSRLARGKKRELKKEEKISKDYLEKIEGKGVDIFKEIDEIKEKGKEIRSNIKKIEEEFMEEKISKKDYLEKEGELLNRLEEVEKDLEDRLKRRVSQREEEV